MKRLIINHKFENDNKHEVKFSFPEINEKGYNKGKHYTVFIHTLEQFD